MFAKFDEIPSMILQDIKERKRYGHTVGRSFVRMDNVKTVYPPTNTVCGGIKMLSFEQFLNKYGFHCHFLEFLGIKTAVENYIRQPEINLGTDPLPFTNCNSI